MTLTPREEELVKSATRMAARAMAETIAQQARDMAKKGLTKTVSGPTALTAFANAIIANNAAIWDDEGTKP